ncbi:putative nucleoside diphosphatase, partial [Aureobasidium melanogenum]
MVKAGTRYGVVLDAGSSGTRVYIYRWLDNSVARLDESALHALPELETNDKWTKKIHPGVSTFGDDPESVGPKHLKPLLKHALKHIPKDAVPETPVFLLATAGMRLLPEQQQRDVLRNVCSYIQSETKFLVPDCDVHIQVIPGETEGLYGWIAANYLLGAFNSPGDHDHGKGHHTYGFLDMGGASAQIAFAPNATEAEKHANDLTLLRLRTVDGVPQEHRVFVTTWLGFGANEARRREYWHTTHEIFEMEHQDKAYDFNTYQNRVKEFCEKDWSAIEDGLKHKTWGKGVDDRTAMEVCFKASWLINMLHEGIGIPRVGIEDTSSSHNGTKELLESGKAKGFLDPFQAVNKIKSTEVSWTLGKMILYASAEIPPATDGDLPVGFGSNVPGIPKDFQYPSGGKLQDIPDYHLGSDYRPPSSNDDTQSLTDQIHDTLFNADAPHRLPGFIFFLLILFIATFYLCGRDRRARIYHSLSSSSHRMANGKSSFLGSLFHRRPHVHDLEDGTSSRLYDPSDFELENVSSASSSDDDGTGLDPDVAFRNLKSSAAPTTASSRTSPSKPKRNLGRLTPDVMDRRGLVVRTESRERLGLDPAANGRSKSRTGSPTRL